MKLYTKILLALVAGAAIGIAAKAYEIAWLQTAVIALEPVGTAFIRLLTMIVLPLVVGSLLSGTARFGDARRVGSVGAQTLAFSAILTVAASIMGLVAYHLVRPGSGLDPSITAELVSQIAAPVQASGAESGSVVQTLLEIIPRNPFRALSDLDLLAVVFFTIFFGAATGTLSDKYKRPIIEFFDSVTEVSMVMIGWVMKLAPYGVFALAGSVFATFGPELLGSLFAFCVAVALGELLQVVGVLGAVVRLLVRMSPVVFFRKIARAPLVAFSTSSSSATLPVSIEVAETELGVSKQIAAFVLSLSSTLNKAGSALYKVVAVMFIAQVYGFPMGLEKQLIVVLASTAGAVGGAGVPGRGLVTVLSVLNAVGMSAQAQAGVALVVGVDRLLDMIRTTVNVTGQVVGTAYIAKLNGEVLNEAYDQRTVATASEGAAVAEAREPAEGGVVVRGVELP
jgi:DAACS family dicarboxylate/amino acid:cation (Na+ or H+) symporter